MRATKAAASSSAVRNRAMMSFGSRGSLDDKARHSDAE